MLDTVICNGTVFDGTGRAGAIADIGIKDGVIVAIGRIDEAAAETIDATGCIVTPGFVDIHTHYDGQAVWSSRMTPSSANGVTTIVGANCGVGFAPCRAEDHDILVSTMEGVEDIPAVVMAEGLTWDWETFPEYLDSVESRPHDIDVAFFFPHTPLRLYVMGERAAGLERATKDEVDRMAALAKEAIEAGALGFSTSRLDGHRDSHGAHIPGHFAEADELVAIMQGARQGGEAIFQMVPETQHPNEQAADDEIGMMARISREANCPVTFTLVQHTVAPLRWNRSLDLVTEANAQGARIHPQPFPRPVGMLYGLTASLNPFSLCPSYQAIAELPLEQRVAEMRKPEVRERILGDSPGAPSVPLVRFTRMFERMYPFDGTNYEPDPDSSVARQAEAQGRDPAAIAYDYLLQEDGESLLLTTIANYNAGTLDPVLKMMRHPDAIIGLGDGGAHYGMVCDASYPTFMLSHWTRDRDGDRLELAEAIQMLTNSPAHLVGLRDRGRLAIGYKADINIIDYDRVKVTKPHVVQDLPSGGQRFMQEGKGFRMTMVAGQAIMRDGRPTGILPGRLVRGRQAAPTLQ